MRLPLVLAFVALTIAAAPAAAQVTHATATVNGLSATVWTWTDSKGLTRTVALKNEGHGNPGHGGYAIQMTYYATIGGNLQLVTVNAETPGAVDPNNDGGFGYFVSHERYRLFADNSEDTIASKIFHKDDSPLGSGFSAVMIIPATPSNVGVEKVAIQYGHYGTILPHAVDPDTGVEAVPLPLGASNYAFYSIPVTTSWVFQTGKDYPRINVIMSLAKIIAPGQTVPQADLVSFDMRGPYGVMVFDNGADGMVTKALWGDQEFRFTPTGVPITRGTAWTWNTPNPGARYNVLVAGAYEMGLYEPRTVALAASAGGTVLSDSYAAERGYTRTSFVNDGGVSNDSCSTDDVQALPSDGYWPYQSVQYSLPCKSTDPNFLHDPAYTKKIAWGSSSYYGTSLTSVYNGQQSYPINAWPANHLLGYNVCVVLAVQTAGVSPTVQAASSYTAAHPAPAGDCANAPL